MMPVKSLLVPPQKILTLPPAAGQKWTYKGKAGDTETEQQFEIVGEEPITVPAGKFTAFHLRLEQVSPTPPKVVEERWFVPGMGYAKIVTSMTLGDDRLVQRITLELATPPKTGERPTVAATPAENVEAHEQRERDGRENGERRPRAFRQRVDDDDAEAGERDDEDEED